MRKESSPAFQFYARDFLASESVRLMDATARGAYITLLCVCWLEGSLPTDELALSRLADTTGDEWQGHCGLVRGRFYEHEGRLYNRRLDKERAKQRIYRSKQSLKGKRSAELRSNRGSTTVQPGFSHGSNHGCPPVQPEVNSASASSSASACTVPPPDDDPAGLWETFRVMALELRGATFALAPRMVEVSSLQELLTKYPNRDKRAWLIQQFLTSDNRQIKAANISIGQVCKWAPWLEAQATAPAESRATVPDLPDMDKFNWCRHEHRCGTMAGHHAKLARGEAELPVEA